MSYKGHLAATAALALVVACGPSPQQVDELKSQQKEILTKLGDLSSRLDKIARAPAPRPSRPQIDANKVYKLPVGNSPVKGPASAKVAIVEFADFQ